jgi:NADH-quinone oxidoreductase subunit N
LLYGRKNSFFLLNLSEILNYNKILFFIFSLNIFSLAGIPPFGGFFVKLDILLHLINNSNIFFVFFIFLLSVINFYYYLRLIKILFFEQKIGKKTIL